MDYWYINTEAKDFHDESPHALWLLHGRAFVSGEKRYARKLQKLKVGDLCFMYANTRGVVAVGRVQVPCDGQVATSPLVYRRPDQGAEYQARVCWFLQFPDTPIPPSRLRALTGSYARQTIQSLAEPAATRLMQACRQAAGHTTASERWTRRGMDV